MQRRNTIAGLIVLIAAGGALWWFLRDRDSGPRSESTAPAPGSDRIDSPAPRPTARPRRLSAPPGAVEAGDLETRWRDEPRPQPELVDREPPPPPARPQIGPDTKDAIAAVEAVQQQVHKAARPCGGLLPTNPGDEKITLRYIVDIAGGHATMREVEILESDMPDAAFESCVLEKIGAATWEASTADTYFPLVDDLRLAELVDQR